MPTGSLPVGPWEMRDPVQHLEMMDRWYAPLFQHLEM
jgi:hypothetical protein